MSQKTSGVSHGENKPCGYTPVSLLTTHFRLMRVEKNCVIPLTETEFKVLIAALEYFKLINFTSPIGFSLSDDGPAIVDSLSYYIKDYYNTLFK